MPDHRTPFAVEEWRVDPLASRIRRGGEERRLEPRVTQVLVMLAHRSGEVVSRQELEDTVWSGAVVGYDAVTNTVNKVRKALGDDPRCPHIIETISKTGYRLIAEVRFLDSPVAGPRPGSAGGTAQPPRLADTPPSLLILPFASLGDDSDQAHLAHGIREDILTDLSRIAGIRVAAHGQAVVKEHHLPAPWEMGRVAGVAYVLTGSVRNVSESVRVTVHLVETDRGFQVWSQRFDVCRAELLSLSDRITERVVGALGVRVSSDERRLIGIPATRDSEAYDRFLRGRAAYWQWNPESNSRAIEFYREAVALDPSFGLAFAQLSHAHFQKWILGGDTGDQDLDRAFEYAQAGVRAQPGLPQAHSELGWTYLWRKEHDRAIIAMKKAIEIDPNYADGVARLCEALTFAGRPEEGLEYLRRARACVWYEPFYYGFWAGEAYYYTGQLEHALQELLGAVHRHPDIFPVLRFLAAVLVELGRVDEARERIRRVLELNPKESRDLLARQLPFHFRADLERQLDALRIAGLPGCR